MGAGDGHDRLAGMACLLGDSLEHQGPAGDGFVMLVGMNQARKKRPPVVNQGDHATADSATL